MTASSRLFNGSTLTFGSSLTKLVGITHKSNVQTIDVSQPEDLNKIFEASPQLDYQISAKFKGGTSVLAGAHGTLSIVWKDGTVTACPGNFVCDSAEVSGDWDAAITGTLTFKPSLAVTV